MVDKVGGVYVVGAAVHGVRFCGLHTGACGHMMPTLSAPHQL